MTRCPAPLELFDLPSPFALTPSPMSPLYVRSCLHTWQLERAKRWVDPSRCDVCRQAYHLPASALEAAFSSGVIRRADQSQVQLAQRVRSFVTKVSPVLPAVRWVLHSWAGLVSWQFVAAETATLLLPRGQAAAAAADALPCQRDCLWASAALAATDTCLVLACALALLSLRAEEAPAGGEARERTAWWRRLNWRIAFRLLFRPRVARTTALGAALAVLTGVQQLVVGDRTRPGAPAHQPAAEHALSLLTTAVQAALAFHLALTNHWLRIMGWSLGVGRQAQYLQRAGAAASAWRSVRRADGAGTVAAAVALMAFNERPRRRRQFVAMVRRMAG